MTTPEPLNPSAASVRDETRRGNVAFRREQELEFVQTHPHCTQHECARHFRDQHASYSPRFAELVEQGMIQVSGRKKNPETSKYNYTYVASGREDPLPLGQVSADNASLLDRFEQAVLMEERFRIQE